MENDDLFEETLRTRELIRNHLIDMLKRSLIMVNDDISFYEKYFNDDNKLIKFYSLKRDKILTDLSKYSGDISTRFLGGNV